MKLKKALFTSLMAVLFLSIFSTSAFSWYAREVVVPYVSIKASAGYWSGVAITNQDDSDMYYDLIIYDTDGDIVDTDNCNLVDAGGVRTHLLEQWFTGLADGRYVLRVSTHGAAPATHKFSVTLFMGNNGTANPGFSFQSYDSGISQDYPGLEPVACGIFAGPIKPPVGSIFDIFDLWNHFQPL